MIATLRNPGQLIAALPAVLGFIPERSVCVLPLVGDEVTMTMRVDLGGVDELPYATLAAGAAQVGADSVVVVIVDDAGLDCAMCGEDYREVVAKLGAALVPFAVGIRGAYITDRVDTGGRWRTVDGGSAGGVLPDPACSPVAALAVLAGRRLLSSRDELVASLAPDPSSDGAEVAGLVAAGEPPVSAAAGVAELLGMVGRSELSAVELARVAVILADVWARDTLLALLAERGQAAAAVEELLSIAARRLPGALAADALTVLGILAYVRGDGALAGVALDRALAADPGDVLAGLLDAALQAALPPELLRAMLAGLRSS